MDLNCLRHPLRALKNVHESLVDQAIDANLRCAADHAASGNYQGFHRHCGHAENLARRHEPDRLTEIERVAMNGVESITNPSGSGRPEPTAPAANAALVEAPSVHSPTDSKSGD